MLCAPKIFSKGALQMSFKNIFAFIIFLVCSLKLCASEFYFHVIFNYSGSEKITILQREPDGSIGYFGDIARDNTRYYLSREEDVTSHNYDYMLSYTLS